ncbi:glycosylhydrolase-like jelly roll fold domain-containing protein [Paenibacillus sp. 1P07SE]|uniref:glycosylhydrolase-like jelly roll fold domain-containing protein n=1 Tax=Paenibacillus sp. 1P07SE TaxID=3132209 RepID=UPI0039A7059C
MNRLLQDVLEGREENYILPFLWQQGEEEQVIREEMARVHEAGIGAVCVEARPHPDFLGPSWWADMDIIMDEARRRGMKVWMLDDDHFPTGHAAGKVKEAPEELHRVFLNERHIDTLGPAPGASFLLDTLLLNGLRPTYSLSSFATGKNKLISVTAVRRDPHTGLLTEECVDITGLVQDGVLYWDIPEGYWRVFIVSESKTGGSQAQEDYLNPLDRDSVRILIDTVYEAFYERYRADFGKTFAGFFSDEPGFYNDKTTFDFESRPGKQGVPLPWSREMTALLQQTLGEDYRELLHLLWHEGGESTNRVRYAYMDTITKLYAEHFCHQIGDWCRARGVEYIGHVLEDNNVHARLGSGAGHFFRSLWGQDMAGIDVVLWQIVPGFDELSYRKPTGVTDSHFFHYGLAKLGVSLSHVDPKKQGRTMCELYGAYGWAEGLKLMKWLTDHMLVRGVNYFVPHAFSQKAFPDPDCPPHMYANGKNPQYRYYKYLNHYINRVSHLLSGGRHVASAAVVYHAEAEWSGEAMYFHEPVKHLMQQQIDCDVIPIDVLIDSARLQEGKLLINQEDYPCLIVPYAEALPAALLGTLATFAAQGLAIYIVGGWPARSSEGEEISDLRSVLAGRSNVKVVSLQQLPHELIADGHADIRVEQEVPALRHYHYVHDGLDVFMFFNENPHQTIHTDVVLPVQGVAYSYDAFLNKLQPYPLSWDHGIRLELQPSQSLILLFGIEQEAGAAVSHVPGEEAFVLTNPWQVSTASAGQYPDFNPRGSLTELTNMSAPGVLPRFSGTFRYETEFEWDDATSPLILDLGAVYETAEVWLNGEWAGVLIGPPYWLDIQGKVQQGSNKLIIEVTNTLVKEQPDFLSAYAQQEPTGLIGPARLMRSQ